MKFVVDELPYYGELCAGKMQMRMNARDIGISIKFVQMKIRTNASTLSI